MSLDVTLYYERLEDGSNLHCRNCGMETRHERRVPVYDGNITHNLGEMAELAGIYKALWRPEELSARKALDITHILKAGLKRLKANPDKYKKLNPSNGWGSYDGLIEFVEKYLAACIKNPDAIINVDR